MKSVIALLLAVALGIGLGYVIPEGGMAVVLTLKQVCGQVIFFMVPLIILGCVAPSIATLRGNVSRIILLAFALAYCSSLGAALFSLAVSYQVIPLLHIQPVAEGLRTLPEVTFKLEIPPLMSVMSALLLSVCLGMGCIWTGAKLVAEVLVQLRDIILTLVKRLLMPLLPIYVAANFCALAYEGNVGRLGIFLPVLLIVILCHYIWLLVLYGAASAYSGRNGWQVARHYGPAYVTALGTMSSAATLGVALQCAGRSKALDQGVASFSVPLFANIHLCGSVLTETFFVCVVSQLLYGHLPSLGAMLLFVCLLGIFAVGAPGVPGGTVFASLGIVVSILGFDDAGTALLIAIYALQDSFGTACNITGDGALTLILTRFTRGSSGRPRQGVTSDVHEISS